MPTVARPKEILKPYPLMKREDRLLIWEHARGIWKHHKPNPISELKKIRSEWERKSVKQK